MEEFDSPKKDNAENIEEEHTNSSTPRRMPLNSEQYEMRKWFKAKGYHPMSTSKLILICFLGFAFSLLSQIDTQQHKDNFKAICLHQQKNWMAQLTLLNVTNTYHEKHLKQSLLPEPISSLWGYLEPGTIDFTINTIVKLGVDLERQRWFRQQGSKAIEYEYKVLEVVVIINSSQSGFSRLWQKAISIADYQQIQKGFEEKYRAIQMEKSYAQVLDSSKWGELNQIVLSNMNGNKGNWASNLLGTIKADFKAKISQLAWKIFPN